MLDLTSMFGHFSNARLVRLLPWAVQCLACVHYVNASPHGSQPVEIILLFTTHYIWSVINNHPSIGKKTRPGFAKSIQRRNI